MNKQRYFGGPFRYSRASWGVLGCPGVIRLTQNSAWLINEASHGKNLFCTEAKAQIMLL